jgi:hypothetical protein
MISTPISTESDSEEADSSCDDDEDDPFAFMHDAIKRVLPHDGQLADRVIEYLCRLPPDRRAIVYGFGGTIGCGESYAPGGQASVAGNSEPRKRRRGSDRMHKTGSGGDDQPTSQGACETSPEQKQLHEQTVEKRFACGWNKFDGVKYCPQNHTGHEAIRYKSCAGPGFKAINHYK